MAAQPAIPESEKDITAPWIQQALVAGGTAGLPAIAAVAIANIGVGLGMVGKILRCRLTYRDNAPGGPSSVIVKLPSSHPETFQAAKRLRLYRREYAFYRQLAPQVPLRSPALLYGDFDHCSHRFVLLLQDLRHMTAVDQLDGASPAQARIAIRAAAQLHGRYWNDVHRPPLSGFHDSANPESRHLTQAVYQNSLRPALDRFAAHFPDRMRRLAEAFGPQVATYLETVAAGPCTFTHGDFRLDNMFFGAAGAADFAVVDWQVCGISSGLRDVAYFLSSSVATEVRRQIERQTLAEYHDIIRHMGAADFTFDDCWRSYRQNMLGCFLTPIIAGGQLDLAGGRSLQLAEVFLQRTLAAIDDLDAGEFLPGSPPAV